LFTALHPLTLVLAIIYHNFCGRPNNRGTLQLPPDDEHPGLHPQNGRQPAAQEIERGPREVDEGVWG